MRALRRAALWVAALVMLLFAACAPPREDPEGAAGEGEMQEKIRLTIGTQNFTATLADTAAACAFAALLPFTAELSELNGNEKYVYLNETLPASPARPAGIACGDLMLFGSNCVVLFYENFTTTYSYTRLGAVDDAAGLRAAVGDGSVTIAFRALS